MSSKPSPLPTNRPVLNLLSAAVEDVTGYVTALQTSVTKRFFTSFPKASIPLVLLHNSIAATWAQSFEDYRAAVPSAPPFEFTINMHTKSVADLYDVFHSEEVFSVEC